MEGYDRYGNISADEYDEYLKRGLLGSLIGKKSNEIIIPCLLASRARIYWNWGAVPAGIRNTYVEIMKLYALTSIPTYSN